MCMYTQSFNKTVKIHSVNLIARSLTEGRGSLEIPSSKIFYAYKMKSKKGKEHKKRISLKAISI